MSTETTSTTSAATTTTITTPTPKVIKAKLSLDRKNAQTVLNESLSICTNVFSSSFFTAEAGASAPTVDQDTMNTANNRLQAAIAAAAGGGRQFIAVRNNAKQDVIAKIEQLASWVSANSRGDMNAFLSSGFTPKSATKTITPPVSERIRTIGPGDNAGQMRIMLMKYPGAIAYEVHWRIAGDGGILPASWASRIVTGIRTPVTISNLTPGTTYVFQARALLKGGDYTDFGDPITRIAV